MRRTKKLALAALAIMTSAGAAVAASPAPHEVTGRIEHLNPRAHHLTVKSHMYRYNPRLTHVSLRRGEEVKILYREHNGHRVAVQILPAA